MSPKSIPMSEQIHKYLIDSGMREHPVLRLLRERTRQHRHAEMLLAPEQGQLMALILQLLNARRTLDVGTFTGYSALVAALNVAPDGQVIACDVNADDTNIARSFWEQASVADKIDLRLAPALETLDGLLEEREAGSFDFAFIDADKGNYIQYFERCLELVRVGGVIAVDNTLWSGRVADPAETQNSTMNIRAFNSYVHAETKVEMVLLPIGDGLTLARKK